MADTALNDEEIQEFFDSPEELEEKIKTLANFIRESNHFIVYTGAGISTSAGIPDFRGPQGVWTLQARNQVRTEPTVPKEKAVPTLTHMSLVALQESGHLKFLVSQNCDGLHLKSGISPSKICELHGNTNCEACSLCGAVYWRNFPVRKHRNRALLTGRKCDCGGRLRYTTVAFSQSMPDLCLDKAEEESLKSDLSLCMGTSMRVQPACNLPLQGRRRRKTHKLVIINLQKTPYDDQCALRIYAKVDDVMTRLMTELNIEIPPYTEVNMTGEEWQQDFKANWKFRTPSNDWFEGEH
jgi:mono-ADP-ribosyltransferase sirtuin 6